MAPFLEFGTHFEDRQVAKYVTVNGRIYYSDAKGDMGVAMEKHKTLALKAGAVKGLDNKPIVEDAGIMGFYNGTFRFSGSSTTCAGPMDKEMTRSVAKSTLEHGDYIVD